MPFKSEQGVLPFDELFAWRNFIKVLERLKQGESLVFYDFSKKFRFTMLRKQTVSIVTLKLNEAEEQNLSQQQIFERTFMASVLKQGNIKHTHSYEKSPTRNPDWKKQIFKCTNPDCRHYAMARDILGKRAGCANCGEELVIDKSQIRNAKIVGLCCAKSKAGEAYRNAKKAVRELDLFSDFETTQPLQESESYEGILNVLEEQ